MERSVESGSSRLESGGLTEEGSGEHFVVFGTCIYERKVRGTEERSRRSAPQAEGEYRGIGGTWCQWGRGGLPLNSDRILILIID